MRLLPHKNLIDDDGNPTKVYSWDYQRPFDGAWFRVLSAAFQWTYERLAHIVSSADISENKDNEEVIRQLAEYDSLTVLPNRYRLELDCDKYLRYTQNNIESFFTFFDLDGFKRVNDDLGYRVGDELLRQIGDFLKTQEFT